MGTHSPPQFSLRSTCGGGGIRTLEGMTLTRFRVERFRPPHQPYQVKTVAEGEGFEPSIQLPRCRISSAVPSTSQPPLRNNFYKSTYISCCTSAIRTLSWCGGTPLSIPPHQIVTRRPTHLSPPLSIVPHQSHMYDLVWGPPLRMLFCSNPSGRDSVYTIFHPTMRPSLA